MSEHHLYIKCFTSNMVPKSNHVLYVIKFLTEKNNNNLVRYIKVEPCNEGVSEVHAVVRTDKGLTHTHLRN